MKSEEKESDLSCLVDVQFESKILTVSERQMRSWATKALEGTTKPVCVRVVNECESQTLNNRYRHCEAATNVLAFPALEESFLGDIALCAEVARQEAVTQHKSIQDHVAHLVIHGVLHLRGFVHDTAESSQVMESKEIDLLNELGIANPYEINV